MSYDDRGRGGGRSYGNRGSGRSYGNRGGGGFRRGPREMYDAICSACGAKTKVPFKPSGDRPVYCRECYNKKRDQNLTDEEMMAGKKEAPAEKTEEAPAEPVEETADEE